MNVHLLSSTASAHAHVHLPLFPVACVKFHNSAELSEIHAVIDRFKQIFQEELPDTLPPQRHTEHIVDIGDATYYLVHLPYLNYT